MPFEIKKAKNGEHYFVLKADNGEVILQSEMYSSKEKAEAGIASVKMNAKHPGRFIISDAKNGEKYFNLHARNGHIIGTSETYKNANGALSGIHSVMAYCGHEVELTDSAPAPEKPVEEIETKAEEVVAEPKKETKKANAKMSRADLNAMAKKAGVKGAEKLPNKQAVVDAINSK